MNFVMRLCDYLYVLDFGVLIAQGTPQEIRSNPVVLDAYLGKDE
jgi:branched-chain amino acid transport system ATP-binding protein